MGGLKLTHISKFFGATVALDDITFEMAAGEIVALLGPSGCGKSTLLMVVAGLAKPDLGEVFWDGVSLAGVPPNQRGFGMMFQDFALFPHKNVFENVGFGLRMDHKDEASIRARVEEMLALVSLPGFETRDVNTLSGGEAQRVALARALAPKPSLLMLDEPLGSVDRSLRERLVTDLRSILHQSRQTALYVTHDQEEAFIIADRVVLMNRGKIVQVGAPHQIYRQPNSLFVARFLGLENLLPGEVEDTGQGRQIRTTAGSFPAPEERIGPAILLIRPDAVQLEAQLPVKLTGRLNDISFRGGSIQAILEVNGTFLEFHFPAYVDLPALGEELTVSFNPAEALQIFDNGKP